MILDMKAKVSEDQQNLIQKIFARAAFIRSLEIELVSFGTGWCEARVGVAPRFEQQHGLVHAGVLMTLADHTRGGAAATVVTTGSGALGASTASAGNS